MKDADEFLKLCWKNILDRLNAETLKTIDVRIVWIMAIFAIVMFNFGIVGTVINIVIGFAYPLIKMHSALKENSIDKIKILSHYWILYSSLLVVESVFGQIMQLIPLYNFMKMLFLLCCVFSDILSTTLYIKISDYFLNDIEILKIEKILSIINKKVSEAVDEFSQ